MHQVPAGVTYRTKELKRSHNVLASRRCRALAIREYCRIEVLDLSSRSVGWDVKEGIPISVRAIVLSWAGQRDIASIGYGERQTRSPDGDHIALPSIKGLLGDSMETMCERGRVVALEHKAIALIEVAVTEIVSADVIRTGRIKCYGSVGTWNSSPAHIVLVVRPRCCGRITEAIDKRTLESGLETVVMACALRHHPLDLGGVPGKGRGLMEAATDDGSGRERCVYRYSRSRQRRIPVEAQGDKVGIREAHTEVTAEDTHICHGKNVLERELLLDGKVVLLQVGIPIILE
jgi:hypothetical protein